MMKLRTWGDKEDKDVYFWYFKPIKDNCIEENGTKNRTLEHDHF